MTQVLMQLTLGKAPNFSEIHLEIREAQGFGVGE